MKAKTNKKALRPTMCFKSIKVNEYIYVLSNGTELTFKDKNFPTARPLVTSNGQLLIF